MAVTHTFPGVFIEEIPSGVRAITGVPTAIAAFVGRTRVGPVNDPTIINSFGDFGRTFGGLDADSAVSYAVRDFFQNGGGQGIVVRLFNAPATGATPNGAARITIGSGTSLFKLQAASPGTWANDLTVAIDVIDPNFEVVNSPPAAPQARNTQLASIATALGLDDPTAAVYGSNLRTVFNLTITTGGSSETIRNVSVGGPSTRQLSQVLKIGNSESQFLVWDPADNTTPPASAQITDILGTGTTFPNQGPQRPTVAKPVVLSVSANGLAGSTSDALDPTDYIPIDGSKTGIFALDKTDIFNILCLPPDTRDTTGNDPISWTDTPLEVFGPALKYCVDRRAMLIVDPPRSMKTPADGADTLNEMAANGINGDFARNGVMYFPRVNQIDPLKGGKVVTAVSCGIIAGTMARTDGQRGVWKAPAGIDAGISGTTGLAVNMTDAENGEINPIGINALRTFPIIGSVVWGARTLRGADSIADDYKYLPVRRFALFLEESLFRGLKFAVFEPNDEPLWSQIRLNVGAFLNNLFRQGAFQGRTPRDAYFVKCDSETTTQNDINLGVVNVLVGFAPLKPAEFVVVKIQQIAGQVTT
jgi:phage tail sheath protein FI